MNYELLQRTTSTARSLQMLGCPVTCFGGGAGYSSIKFDFPTNRDFVIQVEIFEGDENLGVRLIHIPTSEMVLHMFVSPRHLQVTLDCFLRPAAKSFATCLEGAA